MLNPTNYFEALKSISGGDDFKKIALEVFSHQKNNNSVYSNFSKSISRVSHPAANFLDIPFLPIEFFKTAEIITGERRPEITFVSSGTTGAETSRHPVTDVSLYDKIFMEIFRNTYGDPSGYTIVGLLPSYLEREGSSLIYMVSGLIAASNNIRSGFYLHNHDELFELLTKLQREGNKTILFGVTFALLDFVEKFRLSFPGLTVIETGGMKGRRKEMIREEVHQKLCAGLDVEKIHSEYGMTEMLSQSYSKGDGIFTFPPWMKILVRDPADPFSVSETGSGAINIIDLANINSCAFIATQDVGRVSDDGSFEVLGRLDFSDIRGCSQLV